MKFRNREQTVVPHQSPGQEGPNFWGGFSMNQLGATSVLSMAGSRLDLALLELTNMTNGSGFFARCEGEI